MDAAVECPKGAKRVAYALVAGGTAVASLDLAPMAAGETDVSAGAESPAFPLGSSSAPSLSPSAVGSGGGGGAGGPRSAFVVIDNIPTIVLLADAVRFIEPFLDFVLHVKCLLPLVLPKEVHGRNGSVATDKGAAPPLTYSLLCEIRGFEDGQDENAAADESATDDGCYASTPNTSLPFSLERFLASFAEECDGAALTALFPDVLTSVSRVVSSDAIVSVEGYTSGGVAAFRVPLSELVAAPSGDDECAEGEGEGEGDACKDASAVPIGLVAKQSGDASAAEGMGAALSEVAGGHGASVVAMGGSSMSGGAEPASFSSDAGEHANRSSYGSPPAMASPAPSADSGGALSSADASPQQTTRTATGEPSVLSLPPSASRRIARSLLNRSPLLHSPLPPTAGALGGEQLTNPPAALVSLSPAALQRKPENGNDGIADSHGVSVKGHSTSAAAACCSICLEAMGTVPCLTTLCGHQFHVHCYTKIGPRCPLCRFESASIRGEAYVHASAAGTPAAGAAAAAAVGGNSGVGAEREGVSPSTASGNAVPLSGGAGGIEGSAAPAVACAPAAATTEASDADAGYPTKPPAISSLPVSGGGDCAGNSSAAAHSPSFIPPPRPSYAEIRALFARVPVTGTTGMGAVDGPFPPQQQPQPHNTLSSAYVFGEAAASTTPLRARSARDLWHFAHQRRRSVAPPSSGSAHDSNDNDSNSGERGAAHAECAACTSGAPPAAAARREAPATLWGVGAAADGQRRARRDPNNNDSGSEADADDRLATGNRDESVAVSTSTDPNTNAADGPVPSVTAAAAASGDPSNRPTSGAGGAPQALQAAAVGGGGSHWLCLVCGLTHGGRDGCGHAEAHFTATGHRFAIDVRAPRVWDYAKGAFVHRLVQQLRAESLSHAAAEEGAGEGESSDSPANGGKAAAPLPPAAATATMRGSSGKAPADAPPNNGKAARGSNAGSDLYKEANGAWTAADTVWADYGDGDDEAERAALLSAVDFAADFYSRLLADQLAAQEAHYGREAAALRFDLEAAAIVRAEAVERRRIMDEEYAPPLVAALDAITGRLAEATALAKAKARTIRKEGGGGGGSGATAGDANNKGKTEPSASAAASASASAAVVDAGFETNTITLAAAEKNYEAVRRMREATEAKEAAHKRLLAERDTEIAKLQARLESLYAQL